TQGPAEPRRRLLIRTRRSSARQPQLGIEAQSRPRQTLETEGLHEILANGSLFPQRRTTQRLSLIAHSTVGSRHPPQRRIFTLDAAGWSPVAPAGLRCIS